MKLVKNKENGQGGRLTDDGKNVVIAIKEGGNTVIEVVEAVSDFWEELSDKALPLYREIKSFFDDIFNFLPNAIKIGPITYRLVLVPAGGRSTDYVVYVDENNWNTKLFQTEGQNMAKAKNEMHAQLKDLGYIV